MKIQLNQASSLKCFNDNFWNQYTILDYTGNDECSHPMFVCLFVFYVIKQVAISFSMLQCCFAVKL